MKNNVSSGKVKVFRTSNGNVYFQTNKDIQDETFFAMTLTDISLCTAPY